ncbi:magnesium-transporting ATPase (P-type) [Paraburkholderia sp. UCT70]
MIGALVFAYGRWVEGLPFVEIFQAVVGIAVSLIPEGLPAIITITLAIGVQRMAQRNASSAGSQRWKRWVPYRGSARTRPAP